MTAPAKNIDSLTDEQRHAFYTHLPLFITGRQIAMLLNWTEGYWYINRGHLITHAGFPPPRDGLLCGVGRSWLGDRKPVLLALGRELGRLLAADLDDLPRGRRARILQFLAATLARPVRLAELAAGLNLSASRTAHVVRELFGMAHRIEFASPREALSAGLSITVGSELKLYLLLLVLGLLVIEPLLANRTAFRRGGPGVSAP